MSTLTPPMELVIALSLLQSRLLKKIDPRLSAHGINFTEFMVLHNLDSAPGKTMRRIDLADSVGLSASGVTRLLAPMEKNRLVRKEPNPKDARVSQVKLSRTGKRVLREAFTSFEDSAGAVFRALDSKQLATLLATARELL